MILMSWTMEMLRIASSGAFISFVTATLAGVPQAPRQAPERYLSTEVRPVSPSVLASVITRTTRGDEQLELVVLWRGEPKWYLAKPASRSGGEAKGIYVEHHRYGNVVLDLAFDASAQTVSVLEHRVDVSRNARVLLVDGVEINPGTRRVTAVTHSGLVRGTVRDQLLSILREVQVRQFLRCPAELDGYSASVRGACDLLE